MTPADPNSGNLPAAFGILRYSPERRPFSFDSFRPEQVKRAADLPPYLIFGSLDPTSLSLTDQGWNASWRDPSGKSQFSIKFETGSFRFFHQWMGLKEVWGGDFPSRIGLDKAVAQSYSGFFPASWDEHAKNLLESRYQLVYLPHQEDVYNFAGVPDGPLMTIVLPTHAAGLRAVAQSVRDLPIKSPPFPIYGFGRLTRQIVSYRVDAAAFNEADAGLWMTRSVDETGLGTLGVPGTEELSDGSKAWHVDRLAYVVYIGVPLAGLRAVLEELYLEGVIDTRQSSERPFGMWPVVFPVGLDVQSEQIRTRDRIDRTRSMFFLRENEPIEMMNRALRQTEDEAEHHLAAIEAVSRELVESLEAVYRRHFPNRGGSSPASFNR